MLLRPRPAMDSLVRVPRISFKQCNELVAWESRLIARSAVYTVWSCEWWYEMALSVMGEGCSRMMGPLIGKVPGGGAYSGRYIVGHKLW